MLKIAVPNKGSLSETAVQMLAESGYQTRRDTRELHLVDERNGVEFFYLRPRDIATYVGSGALDIGITGRDLLLDSESPAKEIASLQFGESTFRFAGPDGGFAAVSELEGRRVATSYPGLVKAFLAQHSVSATLVRLDGAVESSIRLGVADAIADVVETGSTLRQADLEVFGDPILSSEAVLITRKDAPGPAGFDVFKRRLDSVIVARTYVMMDYDITDGQVDKAVELTPGIESPTVSPLHREGWVAVRSMVPRDTAQKVMDDLYGLGARGILVTDILACRI
jgi:ATP phosphoribosyltransferase